MNNEVFGYQSLLKAIEEEAGIKALEKAVERLRKNNSPAYLHFIQSQLNAQRLGLPYWKIYENKKGKYKLLPKQ